MVVDAIGRLVGGCQLRRPTSDKGCQHLHNGQPVAVGLGPVAVRLGVVCDPL